MDKLFNAYKSASLWKRTFAGGSFKKQFAFILEKNQADEETLLRCFFSTGRIGTKDSQKKHTDFLDKFTERGLLRLFVFLGCVLDEEQHTDDFFGPIDSIFSTLSDMNRVSCSPKWENEPLWSRPGIPCLLESMIQLLSAENTKYKVKNNQWLMFNDYCWQTAGSHAQKLADIALKDLANNTLYADMSVDKVATIVIERAKVVCAISEDEAKKCANYQEVEGDPPGSFKPIPGHCQVFIAAAKKQVNFVKALNTLMKETGGILIFQRYLGLT